MKTNVIIAAALGFVLGFMVNDWLRPKCAEVVDVEVVTKRDTIAPPIPVPKVEDAVRVEVVKPKTKPQATPKASVDTITPPKPKEGQDDPAEVQDDAPAIKDDAPTITEDGEVAIPIERLTFETKDYKAIIEGWRPNLISMELYPETTTITKTVKTRPRFSLTLGTGFGYDGKNFVPTVGLNFGFVLWSK